MKFDLIHSSAELANLNPMGMMQCDRQKKRCCSLQTLPTLTASLTRKSVIGEIQLICLLISDIISTSILGS